MLELSIMLFGIYLLALTIISIPFAKEKKLFSRKFFGIAFVMAFFVTGLYLYTIDITGLHNWLMTGINTFNK